ncbi:MAG TPA: hypothetical protein VHL08_08980, partial [Dongiaceae bacterium]|nr:hypothetical protein [Dongiaceae bacterium]
MTTISKDQSNAFVDVNGDGKKERVGWDTQNSFLLYDADGDGKFTPQDMFLDKLVHKPDPRTVVAELGLALELVTLMAAGGGGDYEGGYRAPPAHDGQPRPRPSFDGAGDSSSAVAAAVEEALLGSLLASLTPPTDYDGLKTLDSNKDGKVDAKDAAWGKLATWRDKNGDGKIDPDELVRVNEPALLGGLLAINLNIDGKGFDDHGNRINGTFTVETADGKSHKGYDAGLAVVQGVEYVEGTLHVTGLQASGDGGAAASLGIHEGKASDLHEVTGAPAPGAIIAGTLADAPGTHHPVQDRPIFEVGGGSLS